MQSTDHKLYFNKVDKKKTQKNPSALDTERVIFPFCKRPNIINNSGTSNG